MRLVDVGAYTFCHEAYSVQAVLRAFGVESYLIDENTIRIKWIWSAAVGGIKVRIAEEDLDTATDILSTELVDPKDKALFANAWGPCPHCGGGDSRYFPNVIPAYLLHYFFVPFLRPIRRYKCLGCGRFWRPGSS